jgi:predicted RNA binding protein YcfA (HicA-like mRNA interferase family)
MLKSIAWRQLVRRFRLLGFDGPYSGGRHLFMQHGELRVRIPNPHRGDVSKHLVAEILRQASISVQSWESPENKQ